MPFSNIDKPSKYFNTVLYTGTGATRSITGVGFQPDWVWIKERSASASDHNLSDAIRGAGKALFSNTTGAEYDYGTGTGGNLRSFDSDGFSLGTASQTNANGTTFVSWCWDANGAGVSNTAGTITSTVSANTTSGFSIVSYTGNNSLNKTVGHGLGVAPKMILIKVRNNSADPTGFVVYHASNGANYSMNLNTTNAKVSNTTSFSNTSPTSTVFSVGDDGGNWGTNFSTYNFIAYCFAEVKGFSKAFSYTGNGSSDGTFVSLGFRPAWLLIKRTDSAGYDWLVYDNKRQVEFNVVDDFLKPNLSDAETTGNAGQSLDFLSNGIKFRGTGASSNASGGTYIGFAIAEQPFVSSKGIVANAR